MITLKNKHTGVIKTINSGFSLTTLLFFFFVPLFRGDIKWFLIMLLGGIALSFTVVGTVLLWVYFAFNYNSIYLDELLKQGYTYV